MLNQKRLSLRYNFFFFFKILNECKNKILFNKNLIYNDNIKRKKTLVPVGFEPTLLAESGLKSDALDHSAKVPSDKIFLLYLFIIKFLNRIYSKNLR